ncbi:MAG TPA: hypothetical protein VGY31_11615 [Terriglobia bacterium]|nr:hypothetical protein [Terriglobia bacterium]
MTKIKAISVGRIRILVLLAGLSVLAFSGSARSDSLLVSSFGNASILQYDATTGAFTRTLVSSGSGGLMTPDGILLGKNGDLLVVSDKVVGGLDVSGSVLEYNATTGAFIGDFVSLGSGGLIAATDMIYGPNGNLFVSDFFGHDVKEYNGTTGAFIGVFASTNLNFPQELVFGPNGNLYVADERNVAEFNGTTGAFITQIAAFSTNGFPEPLAVAFGLNGNLFVGLGNPGEILEYNSTTGAPMGTFISSGSCGLGSANSLSFQPNGELYVANPTGNDILAFNGATGACIGTLVSPGNGGLNSPVNFIDIPSPVATTPEPSSFALFCAGLILILSALRGHRKVA